MTQQQKALSMSNDFTKEKLATQQRILELEEQLKVAREELALLSPYGGSDNDDVADDDKKIRSSASGSPRSVGSSAVSLQKRGYLFKWSDRQVGWGGTKWGLRFVVLENGKISYRVSHLETSPRYVLMLRGCAVRDDGWKRNRRHKSKVRGQEPSLDDPGAYFFVFSIYERNEDADPGHSDVVPLLRFSTPSSAEKALWMDLISASCEYCETDAFLEDEAARAEEMAKRQEEEATMARAMPESRDETLPVLYFAPPAKPKTLQNGNRTPSIPKKMGMTRDQSFRTKSNNADLDKVEARSKRSYPVSKPMHRAAEPSLLSPDAKTQNFRGFLNLGFLILLVSNIRLLLDAIRSHGFVLEMAFNKLGDFSHFSSEDPWQHFPFITAFTFQLGFVSTAFYIEWLLSRPKPWLDEGIGMMLHYFNAYSALLVPAFVVWNLIESPLTGGILLFHATITWMKLVSYAQANEDFRHNKKQADPVHANRMVEDLDLDEVDITYPQNVTMGNLLYFWCAPTLTYQIAFPKFPRRRWWKVMTILSRMVGIVMLQIFLIAQVVNPTLKGLLQELEEAKGENQVHIYADYWLKLCITSTYLWLLTFYGYFHLYLNLFAELLRFGDRVFYRDWWNSATASAFWRLWNMPVHYWLVRHVYFPCIRLRMGKAASSLVVFMLSAVMHEFLISVPFHMVRPWSFLGMVAQMPLIAITKRLYRSYPGSSIGNFVFWISFCVVGQPMAVCLYAVDYAYKKRMEEGFGQ